MATLLHLAQEHHLVKLEAALSWRQQEERCIYAFPRVVTWLEEELPDVISDRNLETSPLEQLDQFLRVYCSGEELFFERQFRPIRHIDNGVWELKTPDLRMFGWFAVRDCFICTKIDTKFRIKEHGLVPGYRDEAIRFRDALDLDEPKFVPGDDPNAVISAFSFPPS